MTQTRLGVLLALGLAAMVVWGQQGTTFQTREFSNVTQATRITLVGTGGKTATIDFGGESVKYSGDLPVEEAAQVLWEHLFNKLHLHPSQDKCRWASDVGGKNGWETFGAVWMGQNCHTDCPTVSIGGTIACIQRCDDSVMLDWCLDHGETRVIRKSEPQTKEK